jgi:hypothetical protein
MGERKSDNGPAVAALVLLGIAFIFIAWPYYLGTWLAVQFGADNPSTARDVTGWVLEVLWLSALAFLVI